jgi:hypothetical protein
MKDVITWIAGMSLVVIFGITNVANLPAAGNRYWWVPLIIQTVR